ncbi:MAG TPA: hypothetical protein VHJ82_07905 [Actinomycetota bacterium]|nr:hypothetical protein [Actinomycetota bacterium]
MIVRIWTTGVDRMRVEEYRSFAAERSLPMFRDREGFLGVLFTEGDTYFAVLTFWKDRHSAEALESSPSYRATVQAITQTGFLTGRQDVDVLEVRHGHFEEAVIEVFRES